MDNGQWLQNCPVWPMATKFDLGQKRDKSWCVQAGCKSATVRISRSTPINK
jgi:hypothetical protein